LTQQINDLSNVEIKEGDYYKDDEGKKCYKEYYEEYSEEECYENCPSSYSNKYEDKDNWKR
jgi:hypothetical protein